MCPRGVDGIRLPRFDEVVGGCGEVGGVGEVTCESGDFAHSGQADDAFEGEVGLIDELAGEIIGAELHAWQERVFRQVVGKLL